MSSEIPLAYRAPDDVEASLDSSQARASVDEGGRRRKLDYPPAPEPLPEPVIDNHTHLDFRDGLLEVSVRQALDAAQAVGVQGAVQVGCDLESSRFTVAAVQADRRLLGAVAIHPNDAPLLAESGSLEAALQEIEELAAHPRIRAIGETGLDYFRTGVDGREQQHHSFRRHIDVAKRLGLALQIHDRDAHQDVIRLLREEGAPDTVVFHCFSGDAELAKICNEQGWYMSFAGTVTFKNAAPLREALLLAEEELLMVETDAPFLTPHPFRGQPNASYLVPYTVRSMAQLRAADLAKFGAQLRANTEAVYGSWD
ncbi:TatD DNase family protein [Psychromicrobium silvestre]|uniref:TatD DNase family protein n=1 Tax=Psychromicrobium silvestre TaxID=1645614 RepID=A0A7Y9LVV6_9MICC|nr:TatD family hydrolase [Psychromicrobium silvestre]NYE96565.1 TatD DNase family protein [Psychromicrobium silvestre]